MLGQITTYIPTSSASPTAQASSARRWSYRVLVSTLRSMVDPHSVVGHERLLQIGLGAFEVDQGVPSDPFDQRVESGLRGAAAQRPVPDHDIPDAGQIPEFGFGHRLRE